MYLGPQYKDVNRREVAQNVVQLRGFRIFAIHNTTQLLNQFSNRASLYLKERPVAKVSCDL